MTYIMIVEDDECARDAMTMVLDGFDQQVVSCMHGKVALEYLEKAEVTPRLIITNWNMPIMDGEEFINRLTHDERYQHIPIAVISAASLHHLPERVENFTKPPSVEAIKQLLRRHTGGIPESCVWQAAKS